jgi:hypothetical protein
MAGTFPGVSNTQQNGINGEPLAGAILTVYNGGTTVLSNVFQDIGLLIPAPNPLVADFSGRLPLFFVADGTYRVRLTDQFGSTANGGFDYPQVPSIGASSSGGGGTPVDPTTVLSTGDCKWQLINQPIAGFVRLNGRTLGNAGSGASEYANANAQALFVYLFSNFSDAFCPVSGGRTTALNDFSNLLKTITLPDLRGTNIVGLDDMGNAAAGRFPAVVPFIQGNATTAYSLFGETQHILTTAELAAHNHPAFINDPTHTHNLLFNPQLNQNFGANPANVVNGNFGTPLGGFIQASATGVRVWDGATLDQTGLRGSGSAHNIMQRGATVTFYMKL